MRRARHLDLVLFSVILAGCGERNSNPKAVNAPANQSPKAVKMDPQDILFSTPTLNDALPTAFGPSIAAADCFQMHEDNWRQFEFVSASYRTELASELAAIDKIWKEQGIPLGNDGTAFRSVHVRSRITKPLDIPMSVAEFEKLFGGPASPIALVGNKRILRDVHAIRRKNVVIYAVIQANRMTTLGIEPLDRFAITDEAADRLEQFITEHHLQLIHWPSRTHFETPQSAMNYLRGNG